jgi:hypothetical protein
MVLRSPRPTGTRIVFFMCVRPFFLLILAFAPFIAGCQLKGDRVQSRNNDDVPGDHWRIRPVRVRVYPSTRFVQYENQMALEARVEFLDEMKDPMKAVGRLRFEVYAANRDGEIADQKRLFAWDVPMLTMAENQEYYDAVTRAYLFRLGVDKLPEKIERTVLRITYMPVVGERLEAMAVVMVE